jgi:hypothetical protein
MPAQDSSFQQICRIFCDKSIVAAKDKTPWLEGQSYAGPPVCGDQGCGWMSRDTAEFS